MTTNNLSNSKFFRIQDFIRAQQNEYNQYVKTIKEEKKEKKLSFFNLIKKILGFNYE